MSEMKATIKAHEEDGAPAQLCKPATESTQLHIVYPEKEPEKVSEMRACIRAYEASAVGDEAQKIKSFMQKSTDPNC